MWQTYECKQTAPTGMGWVTELGIHRMVTIIETTGVYFKFSKRVNHKNSKNIQNVLIIYGD